MEVFHSLEMFPKTKGNVVTLGTFDGVHLGHRKILERLTSLANNIGGQSTVITFKQHPRLVLYPDDKSLKLLNTINEKINLLDRSGIDQLIVIPFTHEFSRISAEAFVRDFLIEKIGAEVLVIGHDHRFGKNREGDINTLKQLSKVYPLKIEEIPAEEVDEVTVSSTKIRNFIQQGEVKAAKGLLGRNYTVTGKVVEGKKLGNQLGFPTANIAEIDQYKLVPKDGVYAVKVYTSVGEFGGMMNIGFRPTVDGISHVSEVHIFDFDKDIYDQPLTIGFVDRIRDEHKFPNIEALKSQIGLDKAIALSLLS